MKQRLLPFIFEQKWREGRKMMRKIVETVVGGTVGLLALYVVARVAYETGHRMGVTECQYEQMKQVPEKECPAVEAPKENEIVPESPEVPKLVRKPSRFGMLSKIGKAVGGRGVIGRILKNPDEQRVEMYVEGDTFRIDVSPK